MDDPITIAEAAKILKVSEGYTRRLLRTEKIEGRKLGGLSWMVSRASVEAYALSTGSRRSAAHPRKGEK